MRQGRGGATDDIREAGQAGEEVAAGSGGGSGYEPKQENHRGPFAIGVGVDHPRFYGTLHGW